MNTTLTHLSENGIDTLVKESTIQQPIIVQIVEFQLKKQKVYFFISDGNFKLKATTQKQGLINPNTDLNAIILIKSHMVWNNTVGIIDFERLFDYEKKIGNPQMYTQDTINPQNVQVYHFDNKMIKNNQVINKNQKQTHLMSTSENPISAITKNVQRTIQKIPSNNFPAAQNLNGDLKDYQTIKGLYIGMERWTIVCRIVKKEYKQFISKKTGKQTKTLNLQLMDRAGMKISGVFFSDSASQFNEYLTENRIYKISKGQIRQQSYNNSKNDKISPYKLIFTNLSLFDQVSDTNAIAKNQDSAITLGECIQKKIMGQQFDVICILTKIQQTVDVKRDDGNMIKKTNLLVADPIKNVTLHATLWNENLIPKIQLVGKSIILSRFKLNQYKNSLSLGNVYRSSIIPVKEHVYQKYQQKVMNEFQDYQKLHEIIRNQNQGERNYVCTSFKELQRKIEQLNDGQWARGDYNVYINKFNLKKWHYDGCPHCSKSAENLVNCTHCQKYVEKTVGHFILGVEVCDSTGSLWTTAYDQWAKKIFNIDDQNQFIEKLLKLNADQLKQHTQRYLYQEFRLRISTKKDNDGKIKHNVSKVYERNYIDETQKAIELINKLLIQ